MSRSPLPVMDDAHDTLHADSITGFGALQSARGILPLRSMRVQGLITGLVAETRIRQTFVNTCDVPLEATYIFPLPDRAAVTSFVFEVAGRRIQGVLKERGEARRTYQAALEAGQRAALAEEERPDVFTMQVGNLMPGDVATVELIPRGPLRCRAGEVTFRFPLVVAERYMPGRELLGESVGDGVVPDTDAVPDASRVSPPRLLPNYPNPVQLDISLEIARTELGERSFTSSLHDVTLTEHRRNVRITLEPGERLNRDFIIRYTIGREALVESLIFCPDDEGDEGTVMLTLVPPKQEQVAKPRDIAFVIDRSGSMDGWQMVAARRAVAQMIDTLLDHDRFAVLAFDSVVDQPPGLKHGALSPSTLSNRTHALRFLETLEARGGTEMLHPLNQAASLVAGGKLNREHVLVLVTDGQVGNERQILRNLKPKLRNTRVFTVGIDQAVNASFLKNLASQGGGQCELVESEERLDDVMQHIHRAIGTPVLTELDLVLEKGATLVRDTMVPRRLPALFEGVPLTVFARYRGNAGGARAKLAACDATGHKWSRTLDGSLSGNEALASVWARGQVRALEDRYDTEGCYGSADRMLMESIVDTSLRFKVLSRFTAFVAVDEEVINPGGECHHVVQAVEHTEADALMDTGSFATPDINALHLDMKADLSVPSAAGAPMMTGASPSPSYAPTPKRSAPVDALGNMMKGMFGARVRAVRVKVDSKTRRNTIGKVQQRAMRAQTALDARHNRMQAPKPYGGKPQMAYQARKSPGVLILLVVLILLIALALGLWFFVF